MKKFIFTIAALVLGISQMSAQSLVFEDVDLPLGGQAKLTVKYETGGESLTSATFAFSLPDGVSSEKTSAGKSKFVVNADMAESFTAYTTAEDGFSVAATATGVSFPGTSGVLGTVTLFAAADAENLVIGESYPVRVSGVTLVKRSPNGLVSIYFDDITFNVNIVDSRITLDETVGITSDTPTGNQNVLVKRTIKADYWNTICLPFAMTADQIKEAFPENTVQLADFTGCDADGDLYTPSTSVKVNFATVDAIEANHPYLIKVSSPVSEFSVDGVNIDPEDDPVVNKDEFVINVGTPRVPNYQYYYNSFVGSYVPGTIVPKGALYLSSNMFYYSTGASTIKAFRGYFDFQLSYLEEQPFEAKINLNIDGDATSIEGVGQLRMVEGVYDLSGRKIKVENNDLNTLQKGVYIIDGKKVTIK